MVPDIYWIRDIKPLRLAIMPRPRGGDWLADEITAWSALGLKTVVSLLHRYEAEELGLLGIGALCERHGICYRSFPIVDRGVPENEAALLSMVRELVDSVKAGSALAVHCRAGIGRSALVIGCMLVHLGVPALEIFPMISRARGLTVPDTPEQAEWLHAFSKRTGLG